MKVPNPKFIFDNAPIKEAICTYTLQDRLDDSVKESISNNFSKDFKLEKLLTYSINFKGPNTKPEAFYDHGYKFIHSDNKQEIQLHTNSISFKQLGKYTRWTDFSDNINKAITKISSGKSYTVNRLTLRKINSFNFNITDDLSHFFHFITSGTENEDYFNENDQTITLSKELPYGTNIKATLTVKLLQEIKNVVLDITATSNLQHTPLTTTDTKECMSILEKNNEEIYSAFFSLIKEELFNLIK